MHSLNVLKLLFIASIGLFQPAFGADLNDPILGQWKWFTKSTKVFHADGRITNAEGSTTKGGTWRCVNPGEVPRKYVIVWSSGKLVDTLLLGKEENRLSGKNAQGVRVSAERLSRGAPDKTAGTPAAEDIVHDYRASLIVVKGDEGSGSGFICRSGTSMFLYTNIHVIADIAKPQFTQLDGVAVSIGAADVAAGRDIARIEVKNPPGHPLEVANFDESVRIGDEVVVIGNSGGGGVVTSIKGSVVGIGPDRIEVTAPFIPGNSGSPIVHVKSGKVIGIATYLTRRHENPSKLSEVSVRRFGYRIDNSAAWEHVDWGTFRQDFDSLKEISALTDDVFSFLDALKHKRPPNFKTDTLRRPATEWLHAIRARRVSKTDRRTATESFLRTLKLIVLNDVTVAEPRIHYTYFREELHDQREIRDHLYNAFEAESR